MIRRYVEVDGVMVARHEPVVLERIANAFRMWARAFMMDVRDMVAAVGS